MGVEGAIFNASANAAVVGGVTDGATSPIVETHLPKIICMYNRIILLMKLKQGTSTEKVVLGTVTYSLTLVLVMAITVVLVFERKFSTAYHWLTTDWREPF